MGSYNRITIALFLLVCLVSVGALRGDGTAYKFATSSLDTSPSTASTPPEDTSTELYTEIKESSKPTTTQQTPTRSTSAPESTNGTDTGTGTGVDVSTGGEGFTTHEVDTASTPTTSIPTLSTSTPSTPTPSTSTPSTSTPSTSTLSTPLGETEAVTEIGTTIIREESSRTTPTQQTLTRSTSAPESTNGITQNAVWTTVSREARSAALGVTSVHSGVTEDTATGTGVDDSTGVEGFTRSEVNVDVTSDGVDTTTGPLGGDLLSEGTTVEDPTNRLIVRTTETLTTSDHGTTATLTTSEGQTTSSLLHVPETAERATTAPLQTSPLATSERATTSLLHTLLPPTTPERATTAPLQTSRAKNYPRGDAFLYRTTTSTPTASTPTTSTLTTSEGETTSVLRTSLPPTTPERTTTAPLQTSIAKNCRGDLFLCRTTTSTPTASTPTTSTPTTSTLTTSTLTTSEGETTSVLRTSPPPAERTTTAQQPTTSSQASTASPSTTHVAQTTAHDESQESRGDESQESPEDDSMNQISLTDLTEEESENIVTLSFPGIRVEDWMKHYDLKFRQLLSSSLTTKTLKLVEPAGIYYIRPTPLLRNNILHVLILPTYSSMKRSALPFVPLNETLEALGNLTALAATLGIDTVPSIVEGVPEFLLPTTQLPTTLPTKDLPKIQPSTTRKPPQEIGFLSNPGLFISLVVIATVSIIIIIVGLIYLLCDRRRGRTGEYITNHTPRNSDLELGLDNPVMAENDKNVSNGNHLSSIKGDMESDMIVPYDNFTQEELMNYEVEDTHL